MSVKRNTANVNVDAILLEMRAIQEGVIEEINGEFEEEDVIPELEELLEEYVLTQ